MREIFDIHCPQCGAPAYFDIVKQTYLCSYCGGKVEIGEALQQKRGFRQMQAGRIKESLNRFRLFSASCSGCGSTVVFEENEALSNCAFCGRSLVRTSYLNTEGMPESVIPFAVTKDEAAECLRAWCTQNRRKSEARKLLPLISELKGVYLPYELIRGPVHMSVSRMDGRNAYRCEGFLNDAFVNCSEQLDNLLLDGMEPYDIGGMAEFDFAYVAGHCVKISDIPGQALKARTEEEAQAVYRPAVRRTLETKAVEIDTDVADAVRLPVLLPVYYLCKGNLMAAVNGQTGKVSVRSEKESHYYFLPWWVKALAATAVFCLVLFSAFRVFGMETSLAFFLTGILAFFFIIVNLCLYSDTTRNRFSVESGREIFTSGEKTFRREKGGLVLDDRILEKKVQDPVYFAEVNGRLQPVVLRFTTFARILKMTVMSLTVLFLPVIFALILNGFQFSMLNLGGSAVWFCIFVPVVPVYILKFGIVELHDHPWIYYRTENGRIKRYREKRKKSVKNIWSLVKDILRVLFIPPVSLAVWFGIISFCVMVYLTAGLE